jgi:hypothetical protein
MSALVLQSFISVVERKSVMKDCLFNVAILETSETILVKAFSEFCLILLSLARQALTNRFNV